MRILIDKTLKHFNMLQESLILCKHGGILLPLTLKKNIISNFFCYIHVVEIPTNKGANSYKLKQIKRVNYPPSCTSLGHILLCKVSFYLQKRSCAYKTNRQTGDSYIPPINFVCRDIITKTACIIKAVFKVYKGRWAEGGLIL